MSGPNTTDGRSIRPSCSYTVSSATSAPARPQSALVERYQLQDTARSVLYDHRKDLHEQHRIMVCRRCRLTGTGDVELKHRDGRAAYGNLMICGSLWVCPVCASRIAEQRRNQLAECETAWRSAGGEVLFLTCTVSHHRSDDLGPRITALLGDGDSRGAFQRLQESRAYKRLMERYGIGHKVRALEVTWSQRNGWHPHIHMLAFADRPLSDEELHAFTAELYDLWKAAAAKEGLTMVPDRGLDVRRSTDAMADYFAKWGAAPARRPWQAADELTKSHCKRGKGGMSPFDLLRWKRETGNRQAAALFREYAAVFYRKQQLVGLGRLRKALGLDDPGTDEEIAAAEGNDYRHLYWIVPDDWRAILRAGKRGHVLAVAAAGDAFLVRAELDRITGRAPPPMEKPLTWDEWLAA